MARPDEAIAFLVAALSSTYHLIDEDSFETLRSLIPYQVLDPTDVLRTINPYWALWLFEESDEQRPKYCRQMAERMNQLLDCGDIGIAFIESVYVREDFRKHGIFRMCLDLLRKTCPDAIMWLNMEPTSGEQLKGECGVPQTYTVSELGQLNLNAAIAEKLGFTVDPDVWHIQAETVGTDGKTETKIILARKCAYWLPESIREIIKEDGDLVTLGRAKQKLLHEKLHEKEEKVYSYRGKEKASLTTKKPEERYLIEEAKCRITNTVLLHDMLMGTVVAAVKFRKSKETLWLYLSDCDGIPVFTLTEKDIYEKILKEDPEDEEFIEYLNEHQIDKLDGVEFDTTFEGLIENIRTADYDNPVVPLLLYIIVLVRCKMTDVEPLIGMARGKYADELDIPMSDVEEELLEELEDENDSPEVEI